MDIHAILKKYWGYDSFRPLQEDIINSVLAGHDTLGLMPTGGGKSITFQVPGLCFDCGVTVVVTPLISLMKDQVDNLKARRIKAVYFHSGMTRHDTRNAWEKLTNGNARFVYIAPERLHNDRFMLELRQIKVNIIVVDEAHCISQWGYDFRPSYLDIKALRQLKPDAPVLALTATATPEVAADIMRQLQFSSETLFRKSFVRDNISYVVRPSDAKIHEVLHILCHTSGSSIVYVRSRKRCREISDFLLSADIPSTFYHAGLDFKVKEERQNLWQSGNVRVMVATNAFGMGIDKPDVRVVIHYDLPPSLEEYYQEAGRAGRDGKPSFAVLLASTADKALLTRHLNENFPGREYILKVYERACNFLEVAVGEGYDRAFEFNLTRFLVTFQLKPLPTLAALHTLTRANVLVFDENYNSKSRLSFLITKRELYDLQLDRITDAVLQSVLRNYTGVFSDFIPIDEVKIGYATGYTPQQVYESLLLLSRMKVLSYVPKTRLPLIYFPFRREETRYVEIPKSAYEDLYERAVARMEAMKDYVFDDAGCRVARMLEYFGEKEPCDCGKCDICRARKAVVPPNLEQSLLDYMRSTGGEATIDSLRRHFSSTRLQAVLDIVRSLAEEGIIEIRANGHFRLFSKD